MFNSLGNSGAIGAVASVKKPAEFSLNNADAKKLNEFGISNDSKMLVLCLFGLPDMDAGEAVSREGVLRDCRALDTVDGKFMWVQKSKNVYEKYSLDALDAKSDPTGEPLMVVNLAELASGENQAARKEFFGELNGLFRSSHSTANHAALLEQITYSYLANGPMRPLTSYNDGEKREIYAAGGLLAPDELKGKE